MSREIVSAIIHARPTGILANRLAPKLIRNTEALAGTELANANGPVRVFGVTRRLPIARHVEPDVPSDHLSILANVATERQAEEAETRAA